MSQQFKFSGMEGIDEVTITSMHVKVGQTIKKGDNLFDIEADKAADTITSPYDGTISKINFKPGDSIKIGDIVIEFDGQITKGNEDKIANNSEKQVPKPASNLEVNPTKENKIINENQAKESTFKSSNTQNANKTVLATPIARSIAHDLGVDISTIKGTGPNGRVLRSDIEAAASHHGNTNKQGPTNPPGKVVPGPMVNPDGAINVAKLESFGPVDHLTLSPTRKAIATNIALSKYTAPHVSLMLDVDASNLIDLRTALKVELIKPENGAIKLTFMPFFIKAIAKALTEERFKILNSTLNLKGNELLVKKYYNIGMAADTDKGLLVPVIKNADKLTVFEIAKQVNDLAQKARGGTLSPVEMQGGTFTITNFGSAGLKYGTPIINYPEVAILGIGILETKAVLVNSNVVFHNFFPLSISIDHRVIDGAPAGQFMQRVKYLLENPALLLLP